MKNFQLTFSLKQHTPLIHFQHEQMGASLRASEVKPKLDQYLFEKLTQVKGFPARVAFHKHLFSDKREWKELLVGSGRELKPSYAKEKERKTALIHMAFDYKINLIPTGKKKLSLSTKKNGDKWDAQPFPFLLANMGGKPEKSDLKNLTLHEAMRTSIHSFHPDLLTLIDEHKDFFFMSNNFGNRQSKGFGSFTVVDEKGNNKLFKLPYKFHLRVSGRDDLQMYKSLFERIEYFYRTLRSGINLPHRHFYVKSLAAIYAGKKLNQQWDKKTIKEKYFVSPYSTAHSTTIKDHFGLSTEESWKFQNAGITKNSDTVDRYKSPLFFKPVRINEKKFRIYFMANPIPQSFRDAQFSVKKDNSGNLVLSPSDTFNWNNFFDFIFNELDLDDHVDRFNKPETDYLNHELYSNVLRPIFEEIKENLV